MPCRILFLFVVAIVAAHSTMLQAAQIKLNVADIVSPEFSARDVSVRLMQDGAADLNIAALQLGEKKWTGVHLHCARFLFSTEKLMCERGILDSAPELPFTLVYEFSTRKMDLYLAADKTESWQLHADFLARPWSINTSFLHAQIKRIATLLPEGVPLPTQGRVSGSIKLLGGKDGIGTITANIQLADGAFSDASGLHAGEKLQLALHLVATHAAEEWNAGVALDWQSGELFWQPLFVRGGHQLQAELQWDGKQLRLPQATLNLNGIGKIALRGLWDIVAKQLAEADVSGSQLVLARIFADYAKPFMDGDTPSASEMSGTADFALKFVEGAMRELRLELHDATFVDGQKRFALHGLNADIPWSAEQTTQAQLRFDSGALWGVPLGATDLQLSMKGLDFSIPVATLPILDGKLSIQEFHLQQEEGAWNWEFSGGLTPISMPPLSAALGWPEMQGSLSGMIPHVRYQNKALKVDGALLFRIFDGRVVVSSLNLYDPFGPAPRLYGNLNMNELDLGALTQAFSFGNVQGRIDVNVNGLELVNWLPVRFDAKVASSPGSYRKKISQKAVQNISALGGAGAAAAVQRSVMSVFENFGYKRIVISCVLRNGVCAMDGERTDANNYFIVKGGGIPAINVMGYNHEVDWDELLNRLKRVIKGNRKAVVE